MKFPKPGYGFAAITTLVIATLGWLPVKGLSLRFAKQLLSELTLLTVLFVCFLRNKWLKLFSVWCVLSAIPHYSKWCHLALMTLFIHLMLYEWVSRNLNRERIEKILNAICVMSLLQTLWMILQSLNIWILVYSTGRYPGMAFGFQDHSNLAAAVLALSLPAFFRPKWNLFIPFIWVGLFLSKSMGGIVPGVLVTLGYVLVRFNGRKLSLFLFLCLFFVLGAVYITFFEDLSLVFRDQGRFWTWTNIFQKMVSQKWMFGWGIGEFKIKWMEIYPTTTEPFMQAHNDYLQVWSEIGLVGLVIILGFIFSVCYRYFKKPGKNEYYHIAFAGFIVTVLNAFVNFLFHTPVALISLVYLAIIQFYELET